MNSSDDHLKLLFIADIVGRPGRHVVKSLLPALRYELDADLVVANGENLAGGFGVTPSLVESLFDWGVDVITSGNHIWDRSDGVELLDVEQRLLRPANYPSGNPGQGTCVVDVGRGKVGVLNLQGRVFMPPIDDPFRVARSRVDELRDETNVICIDFHAEATAEKLAFAHYMDGLVSAVLGTHTHVPTADARILPGGTAYVTDLGMTGSHAGVIGFRAEAAMQRQLMGRRIRLDLAEGDLRLQGAVVEVSPSSGRARRIERIDMGYEQESCGG
jgi:metallophosphoesterase (TIGR00282 family)